MFNNLLGVMVIYIYNQTYGSSYITSLISKYEAITADAMGLSVFSSLVTTIKTLAICITMLLYFMDLFGKVTEKNFSIEQFFKATLRCVTTYIFISNSIEIVGYLMDTGSSLSSSIASYGGYNFFTTNHKVMFINSFNSFSIAEILSYIMNCLIPWLLSMIGSVVIQIVLISRVLEIVVLTVFAPLAIADIYREGTSSSGVQYMKRMLALGLQVAVILVINAATQAIILEVIGGNSGLTMSKLLKEVTEFTGSRHEAIKNGTLIYTKESVEDFMSAICNQNDLVKVLGIQLARLGLIWNSLPLCEEITGAK